MNCNRQQRHVNAVRHSWALIYYTIEQIKREGYVCKYMLACMCCTCTSSLRYCSVSVCIGCKRPIHIHGKSQPYPDYFQNTSKWGKKASDYECTHQMEMFDTHFLYFGQVLLVSGLKALANLVTRDHYM